VFAHPASALAGNPIQTENAQPGTTAWAPLNETTVSAPRSLEGYASEISVLPGASVHFHVSTNPAANYRIEVYRLGWYGGAGGRLIGCLPACGSSEAGVAQTIGTPDPTTGYLDAGWPVTDTFTVPANATSGYFEAKLVLTSGANSGATADIPFIVRAPSTYHAAILVQAAVNTWQAYNNWGGKSLYNFNSSNGVAANHVSFDRPFDSSQTPLAYEYALARFLERAGLDVSYTTDVDTDANPTELLNHKLVISAGHDEYWTKGIRDALEAARGAGVSLAFMGADIGDWQMRYDNSDRTIVEYRDHADGYPGGDPTTDPTVETTRFRWLTVPRPECTLLGIAYGDGNNGSQTPYNYPVAGTPTDRWFANTGFSTGAALTAAVGYEWSGIDPTCSVPPLTSFFHYAGPPAADAVRYTDPASGARVFSAGSLDFIDTLDNYYSVTPIDTRAQQFTLNAFSDMAGLGSQPPSDMGLPSVSGSAQQGQPLTAGNGVWVGLPTGFAYQWQDCDTSGANCANISGATSQTLTLGSGDVGHTVRDLVTATNGAGSTTAASAVTGIVQSSSSLPPLGKATVGALTGSAGANYLDSSGPYTLSASATTTQLNGYIRSDASAALRLRAVIYADDGTGTKPGAFVAVSNEVTVPAGQAAGWVTFSFSSSVALSPGKYWLGYWYATGGGGLYYDSVSGGEQFVAATYSSTGNPPASYGASHPSTSAYSLYAPLSGSGGGGVSPPSNTSPPSVSGTAQQGQTLSASNGSWTNSPTGFAYQWQDCDTSGANCANASGATAQTYGLGSGDVGHTVRVLVTASNSGGSATAASAVTGVVQSSSSSASLGKTTVGALVSGAGANYLDASGPYTLSAAASATKLTGYLRGDANSAFKLRAVIYADDGTGTKPGAFVAVSNEVTIAAGQGPGWVDFPFASSVTLSPGKYWLGYWYATGLGGFYYDNVTGAEQFVPATYSSSANPPSSYGASRGSTSAYSLYAPLSP
jgi:hypothetical protein